MSAPTNNAPTSQTIVRNDANVSSEDIVIEPLTEHYFAAARKIENDLETTNKGCCFGLFSFSWCPKSQKEFEGVYLKDKDRMRTYGVAIRQADQLVVGICKARRQGQAASFDEALVHTVKEKEFYVDMIAVTAEARGKGVGQKLLQWAETMARQQGDEVMTLGVMKGNPAKRLYDRFGFVDKKIDRFAGFLLGGPHGHFSGIIMEKKLE